MSHLSGLLSIRHLCTPTPSDIWLIFLYQYFLFLFINHISQIVNYYTSPLKNNLPTIVTTFSYMLSVCSFGTVTLVSLERFLAICYPIKHHLIKGTWRTNTLICSVWCISFCYALPTLSFVDTLNIFIIWPNDMTVLLLITETNLRRTYRSRSHLMVK